MTNDFITMFAAGLFALIIVFAARHGVKKLLGREIPRWVMPAAAGLAMLGVTIWGEYAWFSRLRAGLPAEVVVLRTVEQSMGWRPWTYLVPITTRAIALDRRELAQVAPGIVSGKLILLQRWAPVQTVPVAWDCTKGARADLLDGATIGPDGALTAGAWVPLEADDAGLKAACMGG